VAANSPAWNGALDEAILAGKVDAVRSLLQANPAVDRKSREAPMVRAAEVGNAEIVGLLLARRLDVTQVSVAGNTALAMACAKGHASVARLLIDAGAPIDQRGADGSTALMWATGAGSVDLVRDLLARRADGNAGSENGTTALAVAREKGDEVLVSLLAAATSKKAVAEASASAASQAPGAPGKARASMTVSYQLLEDGITRVASSVLGADGKVYVSDALVRSSMELVNFDVSLAGPILGGTLHAMDAGGNVLALTAGMTLDEVRQQARERNVSLERAGFDGLRVGNVTLTCRRGMVAEVRVGR